MEDSYLATMLRRLAALALLAVLLLGAATVRSLTLAAESRARAPQHSEMLQVAPGGLLAEVPVEFEELYNGAATHIGVFADIPCFCGCAEVLGHRHLLDCFVRPDGWEAHALGCGVCLDEAEQVLVALAGGGSDVDVIRNAVIARWGPGAVVEF